MTRIIIFILLAAAILYGAYLYQPNLDGAQQERESQELETKNEIIEMVNGLKIEDLKIGEGEEAVAGREISVHYVGTLEDGAKFDSSRDRGEPFSFTLGAGQVIAGWEEGFEGMKVGGTRKLTIPAELGYGDRAIGAIPPNSTLLFEVELLAVN